MLDFFSFTKMKDPEILFERVRLYSLQVLLKRSSLVSIHVWAIGEILQ